MPGHPRLRVEVPAFEGDSVVSQAIRSSKPLSPIQAPRRRGRPVKSPVVLDEWSGPQTLVVNEAAPLNDQRIILYAPEPELPRKSQAVEEELALLRRCGREVVDEQLLLGRCKSAKNFDVRNLTQVAQKGFLILRQHRDCDLVTHGRARSRETCFDAAANPFESYCSTNSTRRFLARPSSLLLLATGAKDATPFPTMRFAAMP